MGHKICADIVYSPDNGGWYYALYDFNGRDVGKDTGYPHPDELSTETAARIAAADMGATIEKVSIVK